ncbi:class I SAM-dependent methyltransferase [Oceanospirillaceae bacterium]|nr:class I SAM-dependent methyltransferase [Oceanospirillaceae bacterium]
MTQSLMISAMGELAVARVPYSVNETLQGFDQADVLALEYLQEEALLNTQSRVVMVNEPFGAMTCAVTKAMVALDGSLPTLWSDSHIAHLGLQHNAYANKLPLAHFVPAQKTPQGPFDLVLFRLPKSHALLRDQLQRILPQLTPSALIIMPIMVKHMDKAVYQLLESLLGTVTTSLARKKARLVFAGKPAGINSGKNKAALKQTLKPVETSWELPSYGLFLHHFSGVFSRTKLDAGAQVLLHLFPKGPFKKIIDLGCGNGIQAIFAAKKWPQCEVIGIDESYMSVASATINAKANGVAAQCAFIAGDCLTEIPSQSADLILCNPPFHQERVMGDQIAMRMFAQAAQVLTANGEFWVVGNRHLGYHVKLKRWFSRIEQVGAHPKFVVLKAQL